jgi:tungstate transport system substrate-binding protein
MRQSLSSPGFRRAAVAALAAVFVLSLAMPALAGAATHYHSTVRTSVRRATTSRTFVVSGSINRAAAGKKITIEIRKPGRVYWSKIGVRTISKTGKWGFSYRAKLDGRFYFRARYVSALSRTVALSATGAHTRTVVNLASTTSTRDSGIWEALKPAFLNRCPEYSDIPAQFVGSGASIKLGEDKNVDSVLTHSPADEIVHVNGGWLKDRHSVMYNDYVVIGPKTASVMAGTPDAAFTAIGTAGGPFISRADNSGTNTMEKAIWARIGNPQGTTGSWASWYKISGTMGMAEALNACNNYSPVAYTLSDRATWLNWANMNGGPASSKVFIKVVNEGDPSLKNQYSVLSVVGAKNPEGAMDFNDWIRSAEAQSIIRNYGKSTFGQPLFYPNAGLY